MDYWIIMKWNEMVLDYNVKKGNRSMKSGNWEVVLDRFVDDVEIFYSLLF